MDAATTPEVVVAFTEKFWANRKGEAVYVELKMIDGRAAVDVRRWRTNHAGQMRPTPAGVCISIRKLLDLQDGINKAVTHAAANGLIGPQAG